MERKNHLRFVVLLVVLAVVGAGAWKLVNMLFFAPKEAVTLLDETGSPSRYKASTATAMDSFSGYAPLRHAFDTELARRGISNSWADDNADYALRMQRLANGEVQFAVFDISSFIIWSERLGSLPGTIVFIIDDSYGAGAVVAYKDTLPNLAALNDPGARVVLTPGSPSDTFFRTVLADINLSLLPAEWWSHANGAAEVYERFKRGKGKKEAYVLWEPYVSMALANPEAAVLIDTSSTSGVIVDVFVANRKFLRDNPSIVREAAEAYFRTLYSLNGEDELHNLLRADSRKFGESLTSDQARSMSKKIRWKNTLENYAHFGLAKANVMHIEDMCSRLVQILKQTGAIRADPTGGNLSQLFYSGVLQDMQKAGFHPGQRLGVINTGQTDFEKVRTDVVLTSLSDREWEALLPVAEMNVPPIGFRRGSSQLTLEADQALRRLSDSLKTWPQYYVTVEGNTDPRGDHEANRLLSMARANAVKEAMAALGVSPARIRATAGTPSETSKGAVTFRVGQMAY